MPHPETSMGNDAFVKVMEAQTLHRNADIRYLAGLVLEMYEATKHDPAIIAIVNQRVLRAMEKGSP